MICPVCKRDVERLVEASKLDSRLVLTACARCAVNAWARVLRTPPPKFKDADVRYIRAELAKGIPQSVLAQQFGCKPTDIKGVNG